MKSMQLLELQSGWGGGRLVAKDTQVCVTKVDQIHPVVCIMRDGLRVGGAVVKGERLERGSDYDHGHTQNWEAFDLNVTMAPYGVGVSVRELMRQGFAVEVQFVEPK